MTEIFGHQWASQHGDTPSDTWVKALHELTPRQYSRGFHAVLEAGDKWPPNLAQFRAMCLGFSAEDQVQDFERYCHKPFDPNAAIVDKGAGRLIEHQLPELTPEEALAQMKATMGMS